MPASTAATTGPSSPQDALGKRKERVCKKIEKRLGAARLDTERLASLPSLPEEEQDALINDTNHQALRAHLGLGTFCALASAFITSKMVNTEYRSVDNHTIVHNGVCSRLVFEHMGRRARHLCGNQRLISKTLPGGLAESFLAYLGSVVATRQHGRRALRPWIDFFLDVVVEDAVGALAPPLRPASQAITKKRQAKETVAPKAKRAKGIDETVFRDLTNTSEVRHQAPRGSLQRGRKTGARALPAQAGPSSVFVTAVLTASASSIVPLTSTSGPTTPRRG
ncbi:hypothetical protein C8R43DRAFT_1102477 [Mycena crocata]|nr:hypothetical protein C8R43DRAFT_1102477 [Mycena crocata]